MFNRIKNILLAPKAEWPVIAGENRNHMTVPTSWVVILAAIPAAATFLGTLLGGGAIGGSLTQAVVNYLIAICGTYLIALAVWFFAPYFGAVKNFDRAFSLVAYSMTASWVGGVFNLIPGFGWFAFLCGIYSWVLLFMGLKPMMEVPDDKRTAYFIVSLLAMIVFGAVLSLVMGPLFAVGSAVTV